MYFSSSFFHCHGRATQRPPCILNPHPRVFDEVIDADSCVYSRLEFSRDIFWKHAVLTPRKPAVTP